MPVFIASWQRHKVWTVTQPWSSWLKARKSNSIPDREPVTESNHGFGVTSTPAVSNSTALTKSTQPSKSTMYSSSTSLMTNPRTVRTVNSVATRNSVTRSRPRLSLTLTNLTPAQSTTSLGMWTWLFLRRESSLSLTTPLVNWRYPKWRLIYDFAIFQAFVELNSRPRVLDLDEHWTWVQEKVFLKDKPIVIYFTDGTNEKEVR